MVISGQRETLKLLLAQDTLATESLVRTHAGWMLLLAKRIVRDAVLAEDVVQNAFANIFRSLSNFDGRSTIKTWMHRIVVNQSLMELRKQKRRQEVSIDDLMTKFDRRGCRIEEGSALSQQAQNPESLLLSSEERNKVVGCIAELPDNYRIVLILRDIEELSTAEVANATGLTETNVKVRLHRARAALKKLLSPSYSGREQ